MKNYISAGLVWEMWVMTNTQLPCIILSYKIDEWNLKKMRGVVFFENMTRGHQREVDSWFKIVIIG